MAGFVVSTILQKLEQLSPDLPGLGLHGARLLIGRIFLNLLASPEVEVLEVFLSPSEYRRRDEMAVIAASVLPKSRQGKGVLRFYCIHDLPEVWSDAQPRVLLCLDLEFLARDRYLRDTFAKGPVSISCQTHGLAKHALYSKLAGVAHLKPVSYDAITCLSEPCRASLERTFSGYLASENSPVPFRLEVVFNPVAADLYHPYTPEEKVNARRLLRLPERGTITLFLGRLTPNAKADLLPLVRQFALHSLSTDTLVICGVENSEGYARRLIEEGASLGLGDRLVVRTIVEPWSAPLFYGASDLFVFPCDNMQECFANTALEAMASGLPTVVSDWDGLKDSVIHETTGFLVPTYLMPGLERIEQISPANEWGVDMLSTSQSVWVDSRELGKRLRELLRSPDLRLRMGKAGRERVEAHYKWDSVGGKLFALWRELLAASPETYGSDADDDVGLPVPFRRLFQPYATALVEESSLVRLTDVGASMVDGKTQLAFYDDTLPLIRQEVVDGLFRALVEQGTSWISMADLSAKVSESTKLDVDRIVFHVGLLLKRDAIELQLAQ